MPSLADVPFLSGYMQQDQLNRQGENNQLTQAGNLQGLLMKMQAAQQEQQLRGVMAQAGGDPAVAVKALLMQGTPRSIELATHLKSLMPKPKEPYTVGPGGQRFDENNNVVAQVPPNPLALKEKVEPNIVRMMRASGLSESSPRWNQILDNAMRKESETAKQISPTIVMPKTEPPVQTYVDGAGKLWERQRGGAWTPAKMGEGAPSMTDKVQKVPGVLNPAKVAEQNAQMDTVVKQIDELKATIEQNSGVASGVVGPKGFVNRAVETVRGIIPGQENADTPALTTQSKKELIVANVRKLIAGGGVFSNQDAKRLDNALSMGLMSTAGSAQKGLDDLKAFLQEKRQKMPTQTQPTNKPKAEDFFR